MTRQLEIEATKAALVESKIPLEPGMSRDPNTRRLLEALCVRYNIPPVFKESVP